MITTIRTARYLALAALALPLVVSSVGRATDKKTERIWKANCAACHGTGGKADTEKGAKMKLPDMSTADWQKSKTDDQLKKTILNGVDENRDGVKKEMDPFNDKLSADQVDALVAFLRTLAG